MHTEMKFEGYPTFNQKEVLVGRMLGRGEFGVVYEITSIHLRNTSSTRETTTPLDSSSTAGVGPNFECHSLHTAAISRESMSRHCLRGHDLIPRYALKKIHIKTSNKGESTQNGIVAAATTDLRRECNLLSRCIHPNIIKLRAISSANPTDINFFFIIDRLYCSLDDRLTEWNNRKKKLSSMTSKIRGDTKKKLLQLVKERNLALLDLASAFVYLHRNRIIYRDLKTENVGFDVRNTLKLFDFNLSRELPDEKHKYSTSTGRNNIAEHSFFNTTFCGNLRFMAPEVLQLTPYGLMADVYSYGLMVYSVATLRVPFEGLTEKAHHQLKLAQNYKADLSLLKKTWNWRVDEIKELIDRCCSINPLDRPNISTVAKTLTLMAEEEESENASDISKRPQYLLNMSIDSMSEMKS